ncbi:MAG: hypothetical protein R3B45_03550 [Bdellovibrionota bacterium]
MKRIIYSVLALITFSLSACRNNSDGSDLDLALSQKSTNESLLSIISSHSLDEMCKETPSQNSLGYIKAQYKNDIRKYGDLTNKEYINYQSARRLAEENPVSTPDNLRLFLEDSRFKLRARVTSLFLEESIRTELNMLSFKPRKDEGFSNFPAIGVPNSCFSETGSLALDVSNLPESRKNIGSLNAAVEHMHSQLNSSVELWSDVWFKQMIAAVIEIKYIEFIFLEPNSNGEFRWKELVNWNPEFGIGNLGIFHSEDNEQLISPAGRVNELMTRFHF